MSTIASPLATDDPGPDDPRAARARRVRVLLLAIVAFSVADLLATIAHLRSVGMVEANPLAAFIIRETGSAWSLASFKLLTVTICVYVLYKLRFHREGEIAAWSGAIILTGLTIYWGIYSDAMDPSDPEARDRIQAAIESEAWMSLAEIERAQ